jgi:hypothetical protein
MPREPGILLRQPQQRLFHLVASGVASWFWLNPARSLAFARLDPKMAASSGHQAIWSPIGQGRERHNYHTTGRYSVAAESRQHFRRFQPRSAANLATLFVPPLWPRYIRSAAAPRIRVDPDQAQM